MKNREIRAAWALNVAENLRRVAQVSPLGGFLLKTLRTDPFRDGPAWPETHPHNPPIEVFSQRLTKKDIVYIRH